MGKSFRGSGVARAEFLGGSMLGRFQMSRRSAGLEWRGRKESEGSMWGFRATVKTVAFILGGRSNWKVKSASHQLNFTCKIFLSSLLLSILDVSHGSSCHAQGSLPLPPRFSLLPVGLSSLHFPARPYQSPCVLQCVRLWGCGSEQADEIPPLTPDLNLAIEWSRQETS